MKFGPGLTTYQFKRQLDHVKYRLYFKKAPYLKTLNLHDRNAAKYMTVAELHQKDIAAEFHRPQMNDLDHATAFDALNPNLETSFGKNSRIDRRRPESAITGWQTTMKQYEDWLSRQEDAQFIRKLPMGMIQDHGDSSFTNRTAGIIMPEKCTENKLVFLQQGGWQIEKHTGVRSENWLNRFNLVPLFGGSHLWIAKLRFLNYLFYANIGATTALSLMPLYGLTKLVFGSVASFSSLLPVSGPVFAACLLTSYSINYLLYYLQHKVQIVEAIWWEPETRSVCIEIYNWLKLWNIEGKHYFDQDKPNVIKIPQKYLSPTLYGPKETKMGLEFDFAQEVVGAENGQIPFNATFKEDLNLDRDLDRSGKCVVLKSMPINETEIENISRLEPFCDLLDFCDRYVRPANPEMIPEMDLSQEAFDEYYEMENLMYQEERIEWEKERLQFQNNEMLKFLLLASIAAKPTQKGLYTNDDHVEVLDHTNFHSALEDTSQLWIIEFYASWCGHCQHFAPVIRKWSDDIQNWGRMVSIGVIDCGDNQNHEICTSNNINGFPTMKYYPIGERNFETKNILDGRNDVDLMKDTIRVIKENIPKKVPISFEDLATVDQVDNQVNQLTDRPFVLVIGDSENTLAAERLIIEFSTFNDISIGLSLQKSSDLDCEKSPGDLSPESVACKFKIEHFPSIIVIKHDGSDPVIVGGDTLEGQWGVHDGDQLLRNLGSELGLKTSHNWDQQSHIGDTKLKSDSSERWRDFDQSKVYLKDIESSILQLLFYDVKIFPIDSTKLDHLKTIVQFLSERYPTTSANLQISLEYISKEIAPLDEIKKRKDWIQILAKTGLTSVQGENPTLEYAACTPSIPNHRGYTCSLWTLFHYLLANSDDASSSQAAGVIHSIVTDFFGCSDCVENFKKEIVTFPITAVNDNKSGVLWLWTLHNSVNKRLSGDESEDPEFPKVQWPSASLCEPCHSSDNSGFNTDEVHQFIVNRNKLENIILPLDEKLIHSTDDDSNSEELIVDQEIENNEQARNDKSEDSEEREEVGGRLEDEDDDEEEFVEEEENIEEKINEDEAIPDSNEGAGQAEDQKTPSDEIIQGEVIKTLEDEKLEEKPQEEILSAELDLDIEVMGSHIEAEIPVDDKELEEVEEILSKELEEQLHAPKIEIIDDEKEVEKQVDPSVIQIASPDVPEIAKEPINVPKKKVPNWIDAGIEKHLEDQKKKPAQKLLGRVKEQKPADNGLAHYINDLHKIGFDEDEIESMLKEVNIARMSEHVSELKRRVENYLAEHRHDNHEPHEDEPHSHDEKWIPGTV